jgi:cyanophycin synthetase
VLVQHRAKGGKAVTVRDGAIVMAIGRDERRVARLSDLPLTHGGRIGFQIENLLASVGAAYALGISLESIRTGIETFSSDPKTVPARFNVVSYRGGTVILDYGHNASALLALGEAIEKLPHRRRKIVYTAAGDRRDEDITRQARIIGDFFHEIYIYEDQCTRGRPDGEIMRIMRDGFGPDRKDRSIMQATGEMAAIGAAMGSLKPGDILLCQIDQVEAGLDFVAELLRQTDPHAPSMQAVKHKSQLAALPIVAS